MTTRICWQEMTCPFSQLVYQTTARWAVVHALFHTTLPWHRKVYMYHRMDASLHLDSSSSCLCLLTEGNKMLTWISAIRKPSEKKLFGRICMKCIFHNGYLFSEVNVECWVSWYRPFGHWAPPLSVSTAPASGQVSENKMAVACHHSYGKASDFGSMQHSEGTGNLTTQMLSTLV